MFIQAEITCGCLRVRKRSSCTCSPPLCLCKNQRTAVRWQNRQVCDSSAHSTVTPHQRLAGRLSASSPESLQLNLTAGSHMWVTPSQLLSSLRSMQSVSPSQRQRMGMHRPSMRHWNSSTWQPPGGRVAARRGVGRWDVIVSQQNPGLDRRCGARLASKAT